MEHIKPHKPTTEREIFLNGAYIDRYYCPNCRRSLLYIKDTKEASGKKVSECEHCGQLIDWSDVK